MTTNIGFVNSRLARRQARRQTGVSMVEFLVALVIFAFGMLGLIGLQTRTLSYSQSGLYRSQATALADDVLDRMRVDRANAKAGTWNTALADAASSFSGRGLTDTERKDWKTQIEALLPSGQGQIAADTTDATVLVITISWDDSRGREARQTFVTRTRL
jgi:type IV pilus assembly protein PilV